MTTYYVATNGNNSASGSSAAPWKTINYAVQSSTLKPGDVVIVRPGTYNEAVNITRSGSAAGEITLKSEVPGEALIRPPGNNGFNVGANYVTVDGFDIKGPGGEGHGITANGVHHIKILNNTVHDCNASGIQFNWAEFITIEGNETYNNANASWYSGISIYQTRNITGDTTTQGYRTIVRNNISHDNKTVNGNHSDGNGIIIDDFQSTQTGGYPNYTYPTLIDGNLVYNNGGKGIAVHWSDSVTVSNNTSYHNNLDLNNTGTWRGELSNQDGKNNVWVNNIAVADPGVNSNNTAIGFYGSGNSGTKWFNNLTFNGTAGQTSLKLEGGNNAAPTAANGNRLGVNPLFVDPAHGDFNVKAGSPAIDAGTSAYGVGSTDVDGGPRVVGIVDIGAQESGSTGSANHAPVANADSVAATVNTAVTISAASLLANDTDADGNTLTLTGVSSPSHGTVRIDGSNVIFTPESAYTGAASFTYSISDGHGGSASASVGLTVNPATSNAAPTFTSGTAFSINENSKAVGSVAARDAEGDTLTFAKAGGADAALFTIDPNTGAISFVTAPDFERPADADGNNVYVLGVSVTDGKHTTPVTSTLQISVKDVAETAPPPASSGSSFFAPGAVPAATETKDTADYELGMKFRPLKDGEITALKYYRGAADTSDTDTRTLHLWTGDGKELAEASVTSGSGLAGWQTATLTAPIKVTAQSPYVVSYGTTQNYADTVSYFGSAMTNADGTLSVPAGAAGVFNAQGGAGTGPGYFPANTWNASNYWADVIFKAASGSAPASLTLTGTDGRDTLIGGDGNDTISGLGGNDRIQGNGGADILSGGSGYDTFVYVKASDSTLTARDTIRSFAQGYDKIDLTAIDAVVGSSSNNAFKWIGTDAFSGVAGQLRTQSTTSGLLVQGDVNGDGAADISIGLEVSYHSFNGSGMLLL